jgi:chemotaxis protein MotB
MRDILREIGAALKDVENRIALTGHTDATPYGSGDRGYSNWELSADRANASRRELVLAGIPDAKLARVVGLAASYPLEPDKPFAPINRRISILVMSKEAEERMNKSFELDTTVLEGQEAAQPVGVAAPASAPPVTPSVNIPQIIVAPGNAPQAAPR